MVAKFPTSRSGVKRAWITSLLLASVGCRALDHVKPGPHDDHTSYHDAYGLNIEYPQVAQCATPVSTAAQSTLAPMSLEDPSKIPALDLTLEEAVRMAVANSPVLRTVGPGTFDVPAPNAVTIYEPALVASSPTLGTEAALSAFDATLSQQLFWANVDQPNNVDPLGFTSQFQVAANKARNATSLTELQKATATGATFTVRNQIQYAKTNQPFVNFESTFVGFLEAEYRQPLLQGAGTTFNRIAGPTTVPGQYNGVLIARINEDISLADFEESVNQLVSDVEDAYWNLSNAYRALEANVKGRESAQKTYQFQQVRLDVGTGRADEVAQARSQYYQFQTQVENALGGETGLYAREQTLRFLIGMTATDGRLLRPATPPNDIKVVFDWNSALAQALDRRVELRRQKFNVKRRELELVAAKLNRRPRLDFLAQYRWRGLGDDLIGSSNLNLDNLYGTITSGNFQEGQAGIEFNLPVGLRLASVAVRNASLNLKRERALLSESELRISYGLSAAARRIELTHQLLETNYNRYQADLKQVDVLRRRYQDGNDNINVLLQAQRLVVTSEVEFYQALTNYNLAIRDFHREKGSLLAYNHVQLAEGPWSNAARADAHTVGRFLQPRPKPKKVSGPAPLTSGPFEPAAIQNTTGFSVEAPADGTPAFAPVTSKPTTFNAIGPDTGTIDSDEVGRGATGEGDTGIPGVEIGDAPGNIELVPPAP